MQRLNKDPNALRGTHYTGMYCQYTTLSSGMRLRYICSNRLKAIGS